MCLHKSFLAEVDVNRISNEEGGDIKHWQADVRITCSDCGLPFRFIGLPAGLDLEGASTSVDAQEARLAIAPRSHVASQVDSDASPIGFSIRRKRNDD